MTRIKLAPEIQEDIERILDHLFAHEANDPGARIQDIIQAIDVLQHNPLIGRPAPGELRELIIGRRSGGYVALYRYVEATDTVFILAIRSGREAGYGRGWLL